MLAAVHGVNTDVRAPVIAFIAFKLSQLLTCATWNKSGARVDEDNMGAHARILQLAVSNRGITISAESDADNDEPADMWIRIVHDLQVSSAPLKHDSPYLSDQLTT